ncbi:MAG TPA: hypothetical protein DIS90_11400 [Cytophagales bacterium]|nr:hypothetical protein [Cytophagales bacterium]
MQTEFVKHCPVCGGSNFQDVLTCEDHTYSHRQFTIQRCTQCELQLTNPRPDQNSIAQFYQSEEYISHSGKSNSLINFIYLKARSYTLKWKHGLVTKRKKKGSILDYGCGTGEFLAYMRKQNWETTGVEPSLTARQKANELVPDSVFHRLEDLPESKYDIITLWHVLEHVPKPEELIVKLKLLLKKDGLIFVAVPNHQSYDAKYFKSYWAAYDVPRHFWHFDQNNMELLLFNYGFKLLQKMPMKLDAYYVSLLSAKYKNNGRQNLFVAIKAFIKGFQSNQKAKKSMNYSSLIYIAKHA